MLGFSTSPVDGFSVSSVFDVFSLSSVVFLSSLELEDELLDDEPPEEPPDEPPDEPPLAATFFPPGRTLSAGNPPIVLCSVIPQVAK